MRFSLKCDARAGERLQWGRPGAVAHPGLEGALEGVDVKGDVEVLALQVRMGTMEAVWLGPGDGLL